MPGDWAAEVGIALDPDADVPLGVQLHWSLRAAVASGRLRPGERLPALRDVAAGLRVNHNTVRAAVAKLEADGVLETRHGAGTFVAAGVAAHARHAELLEEVVRAARDASVGPRELAAALYVTGPPAVAPDAEARRRRALRDEIAVLERVVLDLESALPAAPPVPPRAAPPKRSRGPRLLDAGELQEQRAQLVRRLVEVQQALDADEPRPAAGDEHPASPRTAPARRRRAPRPGVSPA
ncbi:MAG TPA: GntR family transcriptional regulator [Baekduia sp.]|uniref:GntR family transcriptional regulator n=1 Tax=Baekduia sp. TaxID=2600305 RepID=UPI002BEEA80C|nr:GntR family transcriptional regulator [Baekduia sp.]HMJ37364.1 GntR family transcriptional regulator [Baekduia sp.]